MPPFLLVDGDLATEIDADATETSLRCSRDALAHATGWSLESQGLCRGDRCVPVPTGLLSGEDVDLVTVATILRRPLAFDAAGVAVLGASVEDLAATITTGTAPPFTLPDLDGSPVSLADFAGRKKLLLAWASW